MKKQGFTNMGSSLFMLVFFVLALSMFAALTLSSAENDMKLSSEMAAHKSEYYAALSSSEEKLAQIDALANNAYEKSHNGEEYFAALAEAFSNLGFTEYDNETGIVTYYIKINETQNLCVSVQLVYPEPGESFLKILSYKSVSTQNWEADNTLNLMRFDS